MNSKTQKAVAPSGTEQATVDISEQVRQAIMDAGIQEMVQVAITEAGITVIIGEEIGKADIPQLASGAVDKALADIKPEALLAALDMDVLLVKLSGVPAFGQAVEAAMIALIDQRALDAQSAEERETAERAAQEQAANAAREKSAKDAESAQKKNEAAAEKAKAQRLEASRLQYAALVSNPVSSALHIGDGDATLSLKLGNGSSFHPSFDLEISPEDLTPQLGRLAYHQPIDLSPELEGFVATEAILLVEGDGKTAVYRSNIETPLRVGDGNFAALPKGALAFSRLSLEMPQGV